jgi:ribosome-binding factor A
MTKKITNNQPSQRQLRVAEQIRHVIAETLLRGHFHDEALLNANEITVTEVRVSPDLKYATAYVLWLGGKDMAKILPALNHHRQYQILRPEGRITHGQSR